MTAGGWRDLHEWARIIMVIATNTDIMFSARPLKSVEEAIIINVKRYSEVHRVTQTDRCHRPVVLPDNPSRDIGPRYRFHERSLYRIFFSPSNILRSEKIHDRRDRSSSLTCISRHANSTDVYSYIDFFNSECSRLFHAHLFSVRSRLFLESVPSSRCKFWLSTGN